MKTKLKQLLTEREYAYILPSLLGLIVFFIWPFISAVSYSLYDKPIGGTFIGIANYLELFKNPAYRLGMENTLKFMVLSIPLNMALSLLLALLVKNSPHRRIFTLILLMPLVIPSGSMTFFWKNLMANNGWLNSILFSFGFERINFLESKYSMLVIVFIFVWKNLGYNMILFLSGLASIPKEHYESACVDGAGPFNTLRYITLPGILPSMVIVFIMSVINSFKVFKEIYLITGSHPNENTYMLQHFMNNMFSSLSYNRLGAASLIITIAISLLAVLFIHFERRAAA